MQHPSNFLTDEYYNPQKLRLTKIKINKIFTAKIFHNMKKLYKILFLVGVGGNFSGGNFPGGQFSGGQFSWGVYFRGVIFRSALFPGAFFRGAFFLAPKNIYIFLIRKDWHLSNQILQVVVALDKKLKTFIFIFFKFFFLSKYGLKVCVDLISWTTNFRFFAWI